MPSSSRRTPRRSESRRNSSLTSPSESQSSDSLDGFQDMEPSPQIPPIEAIQLPTDFDLEDLHAKCTAFSLINQFISAIADFNYSSTCPYVTMLYAYRWFTGSVLRRTHAFKEKHVDNLVASGRETRHAAEAIGMRDRLQTRFYDCNFVMFVDHQSIFFQQSPGYRRPSLLPFKTQLPVSPSSQKFANTRSVCVSSSSLYESRMRWLL